LRCCCHLDLLFAQLAKRAMPSLVSVPAVHSEGGRQVLRWNSGETVTQRLTPCIWHQHCIRGPLSLTGSSTCNP
jgi:hypothetical protein